MPRPIPRDEVEQERSVQFILDLFLDARRLTDAHDGIMKVGTLLRQLLRCSQDRMQQEDDAEAEEIAAADVHDLLELTVEKLKPVEGLLEDLCFGGGKIVEAAPAGVDAPASVETPPQ